MGSLVSEEDEVAAVKVFTEEEEGIETVEEAGVFGDGEGFRSWVGWG